MSDLSNEIESIRGARRPSLRPLVSTVSQAFLAPRVKTDMRTDAPLLRSLRRLTPLFLRLALGVTFLSAVADRFGLCGLPGSPNVGWGNFARFTQYTAHLNPWVPPALVPLLAWVVTVVELGL